MQELFGWHLLLITCNMFLYITSALLAANMDCAMYTVRLYSRKVEVYIDAVYSKRFQEVISTFLSFGSMGQADQILYFATSDSDITFERLRSTTKQMSRFSEE
jgi:hypothetical protein